MPPHRVDLERQARRLLRLLRVRRRRHRRRNLLQEGGQEGG